MSWFRIWVIANNVFKDVIRDRVLYLVAVYAALLLAAAGLLPEVVAGGYDKMTLDLGLAGIHLLGLIVAIVVGTSLINKEIERHTVLVLIAKPISRVEFIVGKHLGLSAVLAVLTGLLTGICLIIVVVNHITFSLASLLLAAFFTFLELTLLTAVALLFGAFTSSLLATLLTVAVYLVGHLSQDIVALGELTNNPNWQRVANGMYLILPDLERLNLRNEAVYGLTLLPSPLELTSHFLYALFYIGLLLTLTVLIFARRQF